MPGPHEGGRTSLEIPRSPASISTDSSRRGSVKQVFPEKHSEPPTPNSPRLLLTRKRAASLNTDSANEPRIGDLALNSASTIGTPADPTREQVCLCQPDPKIPRPRNAFILYRQHYQAQVVAQNPGLANPEISKIIGEQWREQPPEVKSDWKRLAEEEKQRHQRQYPGYRYQPRRAGKTNGSRPLLSSSSEDLTRCPKCNGQYISTPSTPLTPFMPAFGAFNRSDRLLPPYTPPHSLELEQNRPPSPMQNTRIDPRAGSAYQQQQRRAGYTTPHPLHTYHERENEMDLLSSSPGKRRRLNEDNQRGYAANSPLSYGAPQQYPRGLPISAGYRQQLPEPGVLVRPGVMGPPPPQQSPVPQQIRHQYPNRSSNFDESLRLPPLQTQVASSSTPTTAHRPDPRSEAKEFQSRSVEAMVMTIPYMNKIRVLTKISPPLQPPGPTSPAHETRGAVVAVEAGDKALLAELGNFIKEHLSKDPSCAVKTWGAEPHSRKPSKSTEDTQMLDASMEHDEKEQFIEYLSIVSEWHRKSHEMIKYITSSLNHSPPQTQVASSSSTSTPPKEKITPVALVPTGFSVTTSDTFAIAIPINDSYAPVDHWQWMATLWRGIVGPDLTIYGTRVGREEWGKYGGVEIRGDCSAIIVRVLEGGKMDEKTERRLGFEVSEFVRNVETGLGRT